MAVISTWARYNIKHIYSVTKFSKNVNSFFDFILNIVDFCDDNLAGCLFDNNLVLLETIIYEALNALITKITKTNLVNSIYEKVLELGDKIVYICKESNNPKDFALFDFALYLARTSLYDTEIIVESLVKYGYDKSHKSIIKHKPFQKYISKEKENISEDFKVLYRKAGFKL